MGALGITGAHRVGKTSLAKALQCRFPDYFKYVPTNVSGALKAEGFDSSCLPELTMSDFLRAQTIVLDQIIEVSQRCAKKSDYLYVLDRTPIDAVIYTRAYWSSKELHTADNTAILTMFDDYYRKAVDACRKNFALMIGVQPGIELIEEKGKASAFRPYIDHLNDLMLGEMWKLSEREHSPNCLIIESDIIDLKERVDIVSCFAAEIALDDLKQAKRNLN